MSIVIIRGPEFVASQSVRPLVPDSVRDGLVARAAAAGKDLVFRTCRSEEELLDTLRRVREDRAELVLLDPGRCACASDAVRRGLDGLSVPYIEVHDDEPQSPESLLGPCGPRLTWVNGYAAHSYTLALAIALEHLGCAGCECEVHVGT